MFSTSTGVHACRSARLLRQGITRNVRFASQQSSQGASPGASGAITGGLVGGTAALGITYAWYHFSGAKSTLQTAKQAQGYIDDAVRSLKVEFEQKTPDASQAIQTLRDAANKYASFLPGGKGYVDAVFNDLEVVRKQHGEEADNIVREAYGELRDASKNGMTMQAANEVYNVLSKHIQRLLSLGSDAIEGILQNHPQLKEKLGGSTEELKQLAERLGPEAKKEVDETWQQINDVVQSGLSVDNVEKVRKLVQDKIRKVDQLGKEAFNRGMEQLQPLLNDSPMIKQYVEQNIDALKKGNVAETISKVREAVSSGDTQGLESYLQQIQQKTQQLSSGNLTDWLNAVPGGSQVLEQVMQLKEVAEKQSPQAEELAKQTISEIKQVLDNKRDKIQEMYETSKQEVKKE